MKDIKEQYLYQDIKTLVGLDINVIKELAIREEQRWKANEIRNINVLLADKEIGTYIKALMWDRDDEIPEIEALIEFINAKRSYVFLDKDGNKRAICIPKVHDEEYYSPKVDEETGEIIKKPVSLNNIHNLLFRVAIAHVRYLDQGKTDEFWKEFISAIHNLRVEISKRILTKRFKEKYQLKFNGFNSVALTHGGDINGIVIYEKYAKSKGIEIGDLCIVKRDPLQNVFICCKVIGFSKAPITRINPIAFRMLDGDFDGDNVAIVPIKNFFEDNKRFITEEQREALTKEFEAITPTNLMNDNRFKHLTREYSLDF